MIPAIWRIVIIFTITLDQIGKISGACSYVLNEFNGDNHKKIENGEFIEIKSIPSSTQERCSFEASLREIILMGVSKAWGAVVKLYAMIDQKHVPKGDVGYCLIGSKSLETRYGFKIDWEFGSNRVLRGKNFK